jgi:V8-like Glu-specific endopeptidase
MQEGRMKHLLLLALLALPGLAAAQSLHRLDRADEARVWQAVGRVNIGSTGFCTGALIEPQLVLTAAHCFYDRDSGQRIGTSDVRFVAGWNAGTAQSVRAARRVLIDPAYNYTGASETVTVSHDLALIELDQPVTAEIRPFDRHYSPAVGDSVSVVSYAQDRSEVPSIEKSCAILDREHDVLILSCSVNFGASGSPIFIDSGAAPKITSVVSAMADMNGERVALAVALDDNLDALIGQFRAGAGGFVSVGSGASLAEQLGRSGSASPFQPVSP